jgi:Protein of unknown function (DUF2530)
VTAVITLGWVIALIVLLFVRDDLPSDVRWWVWTCVTGVLMGLFGLWYVPLLKRRRERLAEARAQPAEDQPAEDQPSDPPSGYVSRDSGSKTVSSTDTPGKSTMS